MESVSLREGVPVHQAANLLFSLIYLIFFLRCVHLCSQPVVTEAALGFSLSSPVMFLQDAGLKSLQFGRITRWNTLTKTNSSRQDESSTKVRKFGLL
jgi:hypothetical protein